MLGRKKVTDRYAFVLGIADYDHSAKLANTIADAQAVAEELRGLDFQVAYFANLDFKNLCYRLKNFLIDADGADTIMVYYAGHGIQLGDENYIVPADFDPHSPFPTTRMIAVQPLLQQMSLRATHKLLFLDACRDDGGITPRNSKAPETIAVEIPDPVAPTDADSSTTLEMTIDPLEPSATATRSLTVGRGLARPRLNADQTFIAFAADPGAYAEDGTEGGHSPFAQALLSHINLRGLDVFDMCQLIARDVRKDTQGRQVPWTNSNLLDHFAFHHADTRPVWIMGILGTIAGLGSALIPFDLFRINLEKGFHYGGGELVDVVQHPQHLLTSLFFAFVVAFGAYTWGKRAWWVPLYAGAIYCAFAVASRLLFAPIAKTQSSQQMLHAVNLETFSSILVGNPPLSNPNATFLIAVLFMAIVGGGLTGVGSVLSGALTHRELWRPYRIIVGAAIGSSSAFIFLGFLIFRQWMCPGCTGHNDGVASWEDVVGTVTLVGLWQGLLAANVGMAYAYPRYDNT